LIVRIEKPVLPGEKIKQSQDQLSWFLVRSITGIKLTTTRRIWKPLPPEYSPQTRLTPGNSEGSFITISLHLEINRAGLLPVPGINGSTLEAPIANFGDQNRLPPSGRKSFQSGQNPTPAGTQVRYRKMQLAAGSWIKILPNVVQSTPESDCPRLGLSS